MSTSGPPPTPPDEIRIIGHSKLFYWWPVWVLSFVFALVTLFDGQRLAIVPTESRVTKDNDGYSIRAESKDPVVELDHAIARQTLGQSAFKVRISRHSSLGAIFIIVLLLVILITNVPLRGLWSVVVIVVLVLGTVIISLMPGWWDRIFQALGDLHIYINMAGYLFIGLGLLALWIFTTYFFDRQIYMLFTPGQLKVCEEIGAGEKVYDTIGMSVHRQRDDLFRHWILGLGSGDLIVRTSGAQFHEFHMENVLNVSSKLRAIEEMMRDRPVVQG